MCAFIASTSLTVTRGYAKDGLSSCGRRRPRANTNTNINSVRCSLDQNTVLAVASAILGIGGGIGLVAFTENQGERSDARGQTMQCVDCFGSGRIECNICKGTGVNPLAEKDPSRDKACTFCDGAKLITCYNCAGDGIQPRFLDRFVISLYIYTQGIYIYIYIQATLMLTI